ncbi:MAG: 4-(cytidine 5'-diphospho)-2-C-methyl-D-erythritol kinase [Clostridiales bacterium]|nr:4-(cytidine 5'-diphospho)-2-C-methyl-D-erythritol kinase [Clostridiales bacterium]
MDEITLKAHAKINLGLDVLGEREDGYHEVRMVMQSLSLCDVLLIKKTNDREIKIQTNLASLPLDGDNLVYQAAKLLMDEFGIGCGVEVSLEKMIPVAAGMAGGSSDAAATLRGMNELFSLGLSKEGLMERGLKLGADIPYCVMGGTALAEGIGEKLTALPPMVKCPVLVVKPGVSVSTKSVYQNLNLDNVTHPDIDAIISCIENKNLGGICAHIGNVLESVTIPQHPVIAQIKELMVKSGAKAALMSGSGPSVFGIFEDESLARNTKEKILDGGLAREVYVTSIYNNM